jgi:cyclophilin family peptidyl-prolyl cis-trans isomerase
MKYILAVTALAISLFLTGCGGGSLCSISLLTRGCGEDGSVANAAPVANAGVAQNVVVGSVVTLDGSASTDANSDPLTYAWTLTSIPAGSLAALSSLTAAKPTFTADVAGTYVASLTVNDGKVTSTAVTNSITAAVPAPETDTQAPTLISASASAPIALSVTLTADATDDTQVTGYCFQTSQTTPTSSDACFQSANTKQISLAIPNTPYYVWAKDAAGNVSTPSSSLRGPCNAGGYAASDTSTLPTVCVSTSLGEFVVELEDIKAPITTANFLKYVNDGFYAGTVFHRVISNFMVQGGGFTSAQSNDLTAKTPTYPAIALETPAATGISNLTGSIAMARTSVLDSATSQFFINVVDNTSLDTSGGGYAAFGRVISGMTTTVEAIRTVAVTSNGSETSLPVTLPLINWAYQLK